MDAASLVALYSRIHDLQLRVCLGDATAREELERKQTVVKVIEWTSPDALIIRPGMPRPPSP